MSESAPVVHQTMVVNLPDGMVIPFDVVSLVITLTNEMPIPLQAAIYVGIIPPGALRDAAGKLGLIYPSTGRVRTDVLHVIRAMVNPAGGQSVFGQSVRSYLRG